MRTRAGAEDLAIGRWSCGSAVAREEDEADRWGRPVSVSQRGEEGGLTSGTRSSVTAQRGGSARSVHVGRAGVGRPAGRFPAARCSVFLFPFYAVFVLYLNLCHKSCVDPKIMEIFV